MFLFCSPNPSTPLRRTKKGRHDPSPFASFHTGQRHSPVGSVPRGSWTAPHSFLPMDKPEGAARSQKLVRCADRNRSRCRRDSTDHRQGWRRRALLCDACRRTARRSHPVAPLQPCHIAPSSAMRARVSCEAVRTVTLDATRTVANKFPSTRRRFRTRRPALPSPPAARSTGDHDGSLGHASMRMVVRGRQARPDRS